MTRRQNNTEVDFRHDGTFGDAALEGEFRSHTWQRDCRQLHAIAIAVAVVMIALIPLDGPSLGWNSPVFYGEIILRSIAAGLCVITYLTFRNPPESPSNITLPFTATLTANAVILYAIAWSANGQVTGTPVTIAATLVFWSFAPLKVKHLLLAGASLCLGYLALLALWFPVDYQSIVIATALLLMINALGFFNLRSQNVSERREMLANKELATAAETLRQEIATRIVAERNAGASKEIFSGVFVSCPVPLCLIDLESQKLTRANGHMTALLGYPDDELPDRSIREFFASSAVFNEVLQTLLDKRSVFQNEVRLVTSDGQSIWTLLSAQRFSMPDRETILASFINITDQKQKEIDLAIASEEAEKANIAKSQFLANMSHELRTPLNAIIGFSDIIESQVFGKIGNERYLGYMTDIKSSGIHLLAIINEILDLSKIESNNKDLHQEDVDINEVVENAIRLIRHHAQEKSIQITTDLNKDDPALLGDERAIKQILLNLLSNAVKFTPEEGSITIRTTHIGGTISIEISDTGIGIPEDMLGSVAEPFVQLESSLTNSKTGTGLGLSIAKRLAELHGGCLVIESVVGTGTTARLILPHITDDKLAL